MFYFTADEHYGHKKILEYSNRPFSSVEEMDEAIINNHNSMVYPNDITIHAGDFTLWKNLKGIYEKYINRLKGKHIFLSGSHDYWLNGDKHINQIWEKNISYDGKKYYVVVCHYAMHTWARSHYNSFHLFGHSHGNLQVDGKRYDCGVDNNNYYPVSMKQIIDIMRSKSDNFNLVRK